MVWASRRDSEERIAKQKGEGDSSFIHG
jgi:hypothetical protein